MDKNSIFGHPLNSIDFFNNLASVFGIKVGNENLLKIPARTGSGIIRKVEVALGIDLFFFDFYLKHKIDLKRIMLMNAEEKMFSAICILTPNSLFVSKGEQVNENAWRDIPAILFTSIANEFDFMILPYLRVKAVIINFRLDYLQKECNNSNYNVYKDFKNLFFQKQQVNFKEQAPISIYVKITELHDYAIRNHPDKSAVKSQIIILLMDILRKVLAKYEYEEQNNKALYTKMQIVRQMLEEHLEKKLPLLPVLAKSLALSESTLKRNFKQTFGAGIYEFYLRIKMERARELLIKNPLSVKEVAYKFGYEKTSSFIKMFRKIYTFTPGELKKKMISD